MSSKLNVCGIILSITFVIFNVIFLLIGLTIFSVGIYLQVTSQSYSFITGSDYASGAALLIASGIITAIIAVVGFIGTCCKLRPLLIIYAVALIFIILLEFVSGVLGFVYKDSIDNESGDQYQQKWDDAIMNYQQVDSPDYMNDINDAVDAFQRNLKCCGTFNPSDWGRLNGDYINSNNKSLPDSCSCSDGQDDCGNVMFTYTYNTNVTDTFSGLAWTQGCYNATVDLAVYVAFVSGGIGLAFGLFEIIGVILALVLVCCITSANKMENQYV